MACKEVFLKDRSRSLLYDKLYSNQSASTKHLAANIYHNVHSMAGDMLFNKNTIIDRNGEPIPFFPKASDTDISTLTSTVSNPDVYQDLFYELKPNGNEPVFVNSVDDVDLSVDLIKLPETAVIVNASNLENDIELEAATYNDIADNRYTQVEGQTKASDLTKNIVDDNINGISIKQGEVTSVESSTSDLTISLNFSNYNKLKSLNGKQTMLSDVLETLSSEAYNTMRKLTTKSGIPLFDNLLTMLPSQQLHTTTNELTTGMIARIAKISQDFEIIRNIPLTKVDSIREEIDNLREDLAGVNDFQSLSMDEKNKIDDYIDAMGSLYQNELSIAIHNEMLPSTMRETKVGRNAMNTIIQTLSDHTTLTYANAKLHSIKTKIEDSNSTVDLIDTYLPYIIERRETYIKLLRAAKNDKNFDPAVYRDMSMKLKELNDEIESLTKDKNLGNFLESLYLTLKSDIANIGIVEDFTNKLMTELYTKPIDKMTTEEKRFFANRANMIRQFLSAFDMIQNLDTISDLDLAGYSDLASNIKNIVSQIKGLNKRVDALDTTYKKLEDKFIDIVLSNIKTKDSVAELRNILKNSMDISYGSYQLDSLMDVVNPFAAQVKKDYTNHFIKKDLYINDKKTEFNAIQKKHFGSNWTNKETTKTAFARIVDDKGRIITDVNEDLYDELKSLRMKVAMLKQGGEKNVHYLKAREELYRFIDENFEREYIDEYYKLFTPELRELNAKLNKPINDIKNEVIEEFGVYRPKHLTTFQKDAMDSAYANRAEFLKGDSKEAKALNEMYSGSSDVFISKIDESFFSDYDEVTNESDEARDKFLMRNTSKTKKFWDDYKALSSKDAKVNPYKHRSYTIQDNILKKYKDRDGIFQMDKVTDSDRHKLKVLAVFNQIRNVNRHFKAYQTNPETLTMAKIESTVMLIEGNADVHQLFDAKTIADTRKSVKEYQIANGGTSAYFTPTLEKGQYKTSIDPLSEQTKLAREEMVRHVKSDYYMNLPDNVKNNKKFIADNTYTDNEGNVQFIQGWEVMLPAETEISGNKNDYLEPKRFYTKIDSINSKYKKGKDAYEKGLYDVGKQNISNPKWEALSQSDKDLAKDTYDFLNTLGRDNMVGMLREGMAPAISNSDINSVESESDMALKQRLNEKVAANNRAFEFYYDVMQDTSGETNYNIPIGYSTKINQQVYLNVRNKQKNESREDYNNYVINHMKDTFDYTVKNKKDIFNEIVNENERIRKENIENHNKGLDTNLSETLPIFIGTMADYTFTKDMEDEVNLSLPIVGNMELIKSSTVGTTKFIDKGKKMANDKFGLNLDTNVRTKGNSRLYKLMESDIRRNFYGRYTEPHKGDKFFKKLRSYVSTLGMGANAFSGTKNVLTGSIMTAAESASGYFFNMKQYNEGIMEFIAGSASYIFDGTTDAEAGFSSYQNATINFFNIVDDQIDDPYMEDRKSGANKYKTLKGIKDKSHWALFFIQAKGEALMQNATLFAMLKSHRVVNNKIVSFEEFLWEKSDDEVKTSIPIELIQKDKSKADELILKYKGDMAKVKAEFEKAPQAKDYFIYEDKKMTFNPKYLDHTKNEDGSYTNEDGEIVEKYEAYENMRDEFANFKIKVQGVNHKIHGVYNKSDRGKIEEVAVFELALQFRHWIRSGWVRRFGSGSITSMDASYNVRRNEWNRGSYKTLLHYLRSPLRSGALDNYMGTAESGKMISRQLQGLRDMVTNYKRYWYAMDRWERQDAKRAVADMIGMMIIGLLYAMAKKLGDDDEELKKNKAYAFAVYTLSGVFIETTAWVPGIGWYFEGKKLLQSPMAAWTNVARAIDLVALLTMMGFRDEKANTYQTGRYHGRNKAYIRAQQLIPGAVPTFGIGDDTMMGSQSLRWSNLENDNEAYSLY